MSASSDLYLSLQEAEYYQSEEYQLRQSLLPYPAAKPITTDNKHPKDNGNNDKRPN